MMNDEGKTGSEEAKKIGRAEKAEEKKKPPVICDNQCNLWTNVFFSSW